MRCRRWLTAAFVGIVSGLLSGSPASAEPGNADTQAVAEFKQQVRAYVDLHRRVARMLPPLPDKASPAEIERHQRALADGIVEARADARRGEIFRPAMETVVRRLLQRLLVRTASAADLNESIQDENPSGAVTLKANGRYPDRAPVSTMPPQVLENLPKLEEELEYRFVGRALILLDTQAQLIVDFVPGALPR